MKLKRSKKIILTFIMIAVILFAFSNTTVFGAINTNYPSVDTVPDTALEEAFEDSSLLGLLARLIYAVGRFLEWILGTIFKLLSGTSDFPWADKIVFNAVPLLDVNFINPAKGAFVYNDGIKAVLKNTYSTILSLAVAFFGIVVLITAIKLVISTIASDKAKYKQAIVDWAVGFVMLFCMHYFISFVFYLNEQLVVVASKLVTTQLTSANAIASVQMDELGKDLITNASSHLKSDQVEKLKNNPAVVTAFMNLNSGDSSNGLHELLMKEETLFWDSARATKDQYTRLYLVVSWATHSKTPSVEELVKIKERLNLVGYDRSVFVPTDLYNQSGSPPVEIKYTAYAVGLHKNDVAKLGTTKLIDTIKSEFQASAIKNNYYATQGVDEVFGDKYTQDMTAAEGRFYWNRVIDDLIKVKAAAGSSSGSTSGAGSRLIADLASYFRFNSYNKELRTTNVTGVKNGDNIQIQNMIMYAILVAQSLILFISYVKRLFYVVMLAMLAPIVVVVDFFQKFGK